jgi:hypothetical protein
MQNGTPPASTPLHAPAEVIRWVGRGVGVGGWGGWAVVVDGLTHQTVCTLRSHPVHTPFTSRRSVNTMDTALHQLASGMLTERLAEYERRGDLQVLPKVGWAVGWLGTLLVCVGWAAGRAAGWAAGRAGGERRGAGGRSPPPHIPPTHPPSHFRAAPAHEGAASAGDGGWAAQVDAQARAR